MELKNTIELMLSDNYKDRFRAEYQQLKIRYNKLANIISHWDSLDFIPLSDKFILETQLQSMNEYLKILKKRAVLEGISIQEEGVV